MLFDTNLNIYMLLTYSMCGLCVFVCHGAGLRQVYHTSTAQRGSARDYGVRLWSVEHLGRNHVGHCPRGTQGGVLKGSYTNGANARRRARGRVAQG